MRNLLLYLGFATLMAHEPDVMTQAEWRLYRWGHHESLEIYWGRAVASTMGIQASSTSTMGNRGRLQA
ncbi:hypothetical protein IQ254_16550 [Nodosilinea sp. LEGE 07088]|uniref:hypothetical protein n=1 Tax=Nodosilinea sp. LEGE 07088 TaxID=2777968 RepID=UPI00188032A1|nr:hypothetical protein [Nodosilinea sp. LEGE 07088]MBE9138784.1 hypothetical protein [Nodosilinea sp. LEGE 07088]